MNLYNLILSGVFLHVLADTLGSVGVIISTLLIKYYQLNIADPICSLFIAVMIIGSVVPLLKTSALILLQRTPKELEHLITDALIEVRLYALLINYLCVFINANFAFTYLPNIYLRFVG